MLYLSLPLIVWTLWSGEDPAQRWVLAPLLGLLALGALALDAAAAPPADEAPVTIEIEGRTATATTLLEAWSALSRQDRVNWPFAYVGAERTEIGRAHV